MHAHTHGTHTHKKIEVGLEKSEVDYWCEKICFEFGLEGIEGG